jgi:hypothetical protein
VVLTLIDPLGLAHLVGAAQVTPNANGQVLFQNIAIDYVGSNLQIRATIANTNVSVTSDPLLVYALPTPTKDQVNWFEGAYQTLEGGLPYPLSVQWMARHIAQNYDASLFTHLFDNDGNGIYGSVIDKAYPHLVEVMKLTKELHPGFEIMGYVPAFTDEPTPQGYIPGGWEPPNGQCTGFENWADEWANLNTDSGAPLVDTLFLDWISPLVESEGVKEQTYSYAKSLGRHIVVNAPIYMDNFQFAVDSSFLTPGDGVLIEGAMRADGSDYDSNGNWIPGITINTELLWASSFKPQGIRLFFLTTELPGATISKDSAMGRTGEVYANRYGVNGFTYTNSSLNNVDNTLNPISNAYYLIPPIPTVPTNLRAIASVHQVALSWTQGANDTNYAIYRSTNSDFTPSASNLIGTTSATAYWDNSAAPGTTYYYLVKGLTSGGQSSTASSKAAATPLNVSLLPLEMVFMIQPNYQVQGLKLDASGNPSGLPFVVASGSLRSISVARDASGNLIIFGIDPYSNFVWDLQFDAYGNPKSSPAVFTKIWGGGAVESIAVGYDGHKNIELFAVDHYQHHIWAMKFDNKNNPITPFSQLSKRAVATTLTVGHDGNGNPLLFTIDPYFSQVREMNFNGAGDPTTDFFRPAKPFAVSQISLGYNGLGNPELFAIDRIFGHVFYLNFDAGGTATNATFIQAKPIGVASSISVQQTANNTAELFSIGPDYRVYPLKFNNAGIPVDGSSKNSTTPISVTSISGAKNSDGSIALFGLGFGDNQIYERTFDAAGNLIHDWSLATAANPVKSFVASN